ncbi:MAG: DUF222 domain-containing protein, partial [Actinomycetota bacterium]|nr:DUF222 domain-containing protein [Actinomycetota bacterium]
MERPTDTLAAQAAAFAALFRELNWIGGNAPEAEVLAGISDTALIELAKRIGSMANLVDAVGARVAGEFAARSVRGGEEPLAKRLGEKNAPIAVAALGHIPVHRAAEWCTVGEQLGVRRTLTGDPLPDPHPSVAAALDAGAMSADAAGLILETLRAVADTAEPDRIAAWEDLLVSEAVTEPLALKQACRAVLAYADPDGVEPREEELRAKAQTRVIQRRNGMTAFLTEADPESAGLILAALDARTSPRRPVRFVDP